MNSSELEKILGEIRAGKVSVEEAMEKLRDFPYTDLGFARIDNHRELRRVPRDSLLCRQGPGAGQGYFQGHGGT
ncbi:MAG TPA: hypothetical protein PLA17_03575, partial [Bacteroidales bacterium]|nr:hypothetical protein [Bacteroidales bacterium]